MAGFRDICLQVRYDGTLAELAQRFFEPVAAVAVKHQVRVWSLSRESLLPVSLHAEECRKSGKPLQLLITLPKPEPIGGVAGATETGPDLDVAAECTEGLKWDATSGDEDESSTGGTCELCVRIAAVPPADSGDPSVTRCVGQMVDELGNGIEYVADWCEATGEKRGITVAWSWGDPSFRVSKGINRTNTLWDGRDPKTHTIDAGHGLSWGIRGALGSLNQNLIVMAETKKDRQLFKHQQEAVDQWMTQDCRGIFKMCTGAGKTIAALAGARILGEKQFTAGALRPPVVITVPTRVLADQ